MQITIICPSPLLKDAAVKSLCDDYIKRLSATVTIIETKTKINPHDNSDLVKKKQAESITLALGKLPTSTAIIALDENGKMHDSPQLAQKISNLTVNGYSSICFIIGGAYGLSSDVLNMTHHNISLGKMVWPHRLVGIMLLEQIYRAQQINSGHPYHKE